MSEQRSADQALSELQQRMVALLQQRRALPKDPEVAREAAQHFTGNDRLSPVQQLEIYREQFWLRHTAALVEDFPGLSGILGQQDWQRLAEEYLAAHPPDSFTLRDLGARLPAFVADLHWLPHRKLCEDMARLEWAYVEAFDAADAPPLDPVALAAIPQASWESARIVLAPALRLLHVGYPVAELRRQLRATSATESSVSIPRPSEQWLVVYRREGGLYHEALSQPAFELLKALAQDMPLVAACERAMQRVPDQAQQVESQVGAWFQAWGSLGWVVRVEPRSPAD